MIHRKSSIQIYQFYCFPKPLPNADNSFLHLNQFSEIQKWLWNTEEPPTDLTRSRWLLFLFSPSFLRASVRAGNCWHNRRIKTTAVKYWVEKGLELEIGFSDNSAKFGQSTLQNLSYLALILVILYMHISNLGAQLYISNTCPSHTTTSLIHVWPRLVQVHITHVGATCALKEKSDTKSMESFTVVCPLKRLFWSALPKTKSVLRT